MAIVAVGESENGEFVCVLEWFDCKPCKQFLDHLGINCENSRTSRVA